MVHVTQHGPAWFVVGNCRLVYHPRPYTGIFQKLDGRQFVCDFWNDVSEWHQQSSEATTFGSEGEAEAYIEGNRERLLHATTRWRLPGE